MTEASASQAPTVRSLLVGWANEQGGWVRSLVAEVIVSGKALTSSQIDSLYQGFLLEKALEPGIPESVPKLSDDVSSLDVSSGLLLTQLRDLKNVNALAEAQTIDFNPKLTIVFGENACGKTGYVRVLKKAAAVRTTEAVLPDLTQAQPNKQPPSAMISYRLGQEDPQDVEWRDEAGLTPFNRIDVFDSRATALHVDGDLNYVYTPGELARFPWVQQGIEGVRQRLDLAVTGKTRPNPFFQQFDRQSRIYALVESLGAATELAELKALAIVSEMEQNEIPNLKNEVEALRSTNPAAQLKLAEAVKQNLDSLSKLFLVTGAFDLPGYTRSLERLQTAKRKHEKATRESFAGLPIPGLLQEEWRRFIQAGEDYLKTLEAHEHTPSEGEECLYCRQPLSLEAVSLIKKYRDYCNNDLRAELGDAQRVTETFQRACQGDFGDAERRVEELAGSGAGITEPQISEIRAFVSQSKAVYDAVISRKPIEWANQVTDKGASTQVAGRCPVAQRCSTERPSGTP